MLLCTVVFVYPESSADEMAAFIVNNGGNVYSRQAIYKRCDDLGLTRKRASTEAYDAFSPRSLLRAELFWSHPPPLGVNNVQRRRLIDIDECGFTLELIVPKYGRSYKSLRVRKPGQYTRGKKLTVLCAVEPGDPALAANIDGSVDNPRRWLLVTEQAGTTAILFAAFCNTICTDIETNPAPGDVDSRRWLMWDNLTSHGSPLVHQAVEGRPSANEFGIIPRPPYQPKFGPIEYIFCELASELQRRIQRDWTLATLRVEIQNVVAGLGRQGRFNNSFAHCGY